MDYLRLIAGIVITAFLAIIAVLNRDNVTFFWSPIHSSIQIPLYFVILCAAAFGFVFGSVVTWINMGTVRKQKRQQKKDIRLLEMELEKLTKSRDLALSSQTLIPTAPTRI